MIVHARYYTNNGWMVYGIFRSIKDAKKTILDRDFLRNGWSNITECENYNEVWIERRSDGKQLYSHKRGTTTFEKLL